MKIFKYTLLIQDEQEVIILGLKEVLSVLNQGELLVLYAVVEDSEKESVLTIAIHGTGHEIPVERLKEWVFLDSVPQYDGQLIWHVFYKK